MRNIISRNGANGIDFDGSDNFVYDNTLSNQTNLTDRSSANYVVAHGTPLNAPTSKYFYPPTIDNQHNDPILNGVTRTVDVGLLFDPSRKNETEFCRRYAEALEQYLPTMSIQFNAPYKGIDDGFPTYLRTVFPDECYIGIEVEINQKYIGTKDWEPIMHALKNGITKVLDELPYL